METLTARPMLELAVELAKEIKISDSFHSDHDKIYVNPSITFVNNVGMYVVWPVRVLHEMGFTDQEISSWVKMDIDKFKHWSGIYNS